mgnify:CR=1 FL=1
MSIYWPSRKSPQGFSITKLARKYRDKLSSDSVKSCNNQDLNNSIIHEYLHDTHWANRDFSEYFYR